MGSLPKGVLRVLTWFDSVSDELKALINDNGRMPVSIDEQNVNLDTQSLVYDGSSWVKSPIPWGYTDTWAEQVYVADADAGVNTLTSVAVPAGYVYVLSGMTSQNADSITTRYHDVIASGITIRFGIYTAVAAGAIQITLQVNCPLKAGDTARVLFIGCTALDALTVKFWGYKMKVNM